LNGNGLRDMMVTLRMKGVIKLHELKSRNARGRQINPWKM